jgi:hypothetical protein
MNNLKKCPFCGGEADTYWLRTKKNGLICQVKCNTCFSQTKAFAYRGYAPTEEDIDWNNLGFIQARDIWNRRVNEEG